MKRRDFLELSAVASVAIMMGNLSEFRNVHPGYHERRDPDARYRPRMHGGCHDFRMMKDRAPGFFEREIVDSWA